jgi:hypothetical protein
MMRDYFSEVVTPERAAGNQTRSGRIHDQVIPFVVKFSDQERFCDAVS